MQHHDGADAGGLVAHEIEARVRQQFLQFDWPFVEGKRLQKAGRRIVVNAVTVIRIAPQRALGRMEDRASTVEHDALFGRPQRSLGEKVAQQLFVILPDRLRQHAFHMMADRDRQSEALRVEGACRARYVHHAEQFPVGGIVNRNGSAGPSLHLGAEMLCAVDLDRFRFRYRSADRVGADIGFAPASSMFQMNRATGVNDPVIALGIDDQSGGIGEDHD